MPNLFLLLLVAVSSASASSLLVHYEFWKYMGYKIPNSVFPSRNLFLSQVNFPVIMDRSLYFSSATAVLDSSIHFKNEAFSLSLWVSLVQDKAFQFTLSSYIGTDYLLNIKIYPSSIDISGNISSNPISTTSTSISLPINSWSLITLEILPDSTSHLSSIHLYSFSDLKASINLQENLQISAKNAFYMIGGIESDIEFYLYEMWISDQIIDKTSYYSTDCPSCELCMINPYPICLEAPDGPNRNLNGDECPECLEYRTCDENAECIVNCYNGCESLACDRNSLMCFEPPKCPSTCNCEEDSLECSGCSDENHILLGNLCECKEGYYQIEPNSECIGCQNNCISCEFSESVVCLMCIDYSYYENGECECYNPGETSCIQSCPPGYKTDSSTSPISCTLIPKPDPDPIPDPEPKDSQTSEDKIAESIKSTTSSTVKSSTTTALTFSFFTFQTNLVWSLINILQIFTYIPLLNINLPLILHSFLKSLNEYSIIPDAFQYFIYEEGPEPFDRAEDIGFNTAQILLNLGKFLSILMVIVILHVSLLLIKAAFKYFRCDCVCFERLVLKLLAKFHWNTYIRYLLEGYLDILITSLIQIYYVIYIQYSYDSAGLIVNFILGIVGIAVSISLPISLILFIHLNHNRFNQEAYKRKFGEIYEEFKNDQGPKSSYFYVIFVARRMILAICFVYLQDNKEIQVIIASISCWLVFLWILRMKPYNSKVILMVNLIIEFIVAVVYSLVGFFMVDMEDSSREIMEWVVISLVLAGCGVSLGGIIYNNIVAIVGICKKRNGVDNTKVVPLVEIESKDQIITFRNQDTELEESRQVIEVTTIDTRIN